MECENEYGEIIKNIKDPVHGYIGINQLEQKIIDTLQFQKLKGIRQLTANHVYPSVNHTRFEHSLGVMYIAKKIFEQLKDELISLKKVTKKNFNDYFQNLSLAALLHDVGHTPLSHIGEKFLKKESIVKALKTKCKDLKINSNDEIFKIEEISSYSAHELMSCYVALNKFYDFLKEQFKKVDFELILRCIIGKKYKKPDNVRNILISIINSDTIDADKLDYIMRDSYMSGLSVPRIDLTRLLSGACINKKTNKLAFNFNSLSVVQNIIDARDFLYLWLYNHHAVVYTDFLIEELIRENSYVFAKNFKIEGVEINKKKGAKLKGKSPKGGGNALIKKICNLALTDSEVLGYIRQECTKGKGYKERLYEQLFGRNFLKQLWKDIYRFKSFFEENIEDKDLASDFIKKICDKESKGFIEGILKKIRKNCDLEKGEILIIPRSNKFYSLNVNNKFKIYDKRNVRDISLDEILPQKDYKLLYKDVAFYVYYSKEKNVTEEQLKKELINQINEAAESLDY